MKKYKICNTCIIDNCYDINVKFSNGKCSYCINFESNIRPNQIKNLKKKKQFEDYLIKKLTYDRKKNKSDYDCLIGISGGVDSSFLVYHVVKNLNLKPLLYHVDTGWNNRIAVSNIEKLIEKFNLDLFTEVIDWKEIRDLTRSFLFTQVPYLESIQDHAIWAGMHLYAKENNIKNILTGGNLQTECFRAPLYIAYYAGDLTLIKDIHKRFGKTKLTKYPQLDLLYYKIFYKFIYKINLYQPLNFTIYNKALVIKVLTEEIGWENYGAKHHESNHTKFFDGYWKKIKFNHDARVGQLSSLIVNNQMSRSDALLEIQKKPYNENLIHKEFKYVAEKLDFTVDELKNILKGKNKFYFDYNSKSTLLKLATSILRFFKIENRNIK
jgi:N-acetyl sugar amidotransferase